MGGSSAINYMVYMRGNKLDYDKWAELGNHGWSYKEVLPYFKKAENNRDFEAHDKLYHDIGGPLNVERFRYIDSGTLMMVKAWKESGLPLTDFNGPHQIGTEVAQSTSRDGKRFSANSAYIRPIIHKRPNLHVITETFVTKIIIDPFTKVALGVQYFRHGTYHTVYARNEVISSAGAFNSPKLLMLSGIGPKEHLEVVNIPVLADLKVGFNLMDHVTTDLLTLEAGNASTLVDSEYLLDSVYDYHQQGPKKHGPLSTTSTLNAVAFFKTPFALEDAPDIQVHVDGRNVKELYGDMQTYLDTGIFPLSYYDGLAIRPLLLVPKSRGFVTLNVTDPTFGPPLIYPRYFTEPYDLETLVSACKSTVALENTEVFRKMGARFVRQPPKGCELFLFGTDEYFECILKLYTSTIYHPAGTCKMGPEWDKYAVVDPKLHVYGIKHLRVVDSSIMPVIVRSNLNAPTIMIAEKAADFIKEEWFKF